MPAKKTKKMTKKPAKKAVKTTKKVAAKKVKKTKKVKPSVAKQTVPVVVVSPVVDASGVVTMNAVQDDVLN